MLKKLRLKFVLFSMTIVTLMLAIILCLLYFSTRRNLELENMQMMERISMSPMPMSRPNMPKDEIRLPHFSISLDREGEIEDVRGNFFDLSDESSIEEIYREVLEEGSNDGVLDSYNLRYRTFDTPQGKSIVFLDIANEQNMLKSLLKPLLIVGIIAFFLFLGLSILMAKWAVKPVENAWNQQKQFIADASHELKTPLTVIMTNAELLSSDRCSAADRKQYSGNIQTMSKQMRGLVESLLDLARLDAGTKVAAHQHMSLSDTVSNAAMNFEPVFFEKGMPFSYDVESDIHINGNPSQLKQLVEILLDNASKYALPSGETVLTLKAVSKRACTVEVKNQGEEISSADLENIFKRFYRADKARTMNHSYGLGLPIAQSICEDHGGKISASSSEGWNRFVVSLPREEN